MYSKSRVYFLLVVPWFFHSSLIYLPMWPCYQTSMVLCMHPKWNFIFHFSLKSLLQNGQLNLVDCYHNSLYVFSDDVFVWMCECSSCKWIEAVLRTRILNVWIMYVCVCSFDRNVKDTAIHGLKVILNEHIFKSLFIILIQYR